MQGNKISDCDKFVSAKHRGFIIDISIQDCFYVDSNSYEHANNATLDLSKRLCRRKFKEKLDKCI